MQRDRNFASYEDLEARYDKRPSTWVTPKGNWGAGRVELVQIPSPDETNDNIVAYWVPAQMPPPGQPLEFELAAGQCMADLRAVLQAHLAETARSALAALPRT